MSSNARRPLALCLLLALLTPAHAGPLSPPAGPVAPTHKTLSEMEPRTPISSLPFTISQPGSYYLTRTLTASPGGGGITITAQDVTLDLRGYALIGTGGAGSGVATSSPFPPSGITVVNGAVRGWPGGGVVLAGARNRVEGVTVFNNTGDGIAVGSISSVFRCTAEANARGIAAGQNCSVDACTVTGSTSDGVVTARASTVRSCIARANAGDGIAAADMCLLRDCTAVLNGARGVFAGEGSAVTNCVAYDNNEGGISVMNGCSVRACTATANTGAGILGAFNVTVADSASNYNTGAGIRLDTGGLILANSCNNNGAAGVEVTGMRTRIEGNNAGGNGRGYHITGTNNLVVRNSAHGNTTANYTIAAGNGAVAVVVPGSPAINGFAGGTGLGTTDPWANLSY